MASKGLDAGPEKQTGYTYKGFPIILSKTRGRPPSGKLTKGKLGWWSEKKRIEALTIFAATGRISETENLTGVPGHTIRDWLKQEWALKLLDEIRVENDYAVDAKFTQVIGEANELLLDRLRNGDEKLLRDGTRIKLAVPAKDLAIITAINVDKRQLLRGKPTSRSESVSESGRLQKLEQMFLKLANRTVGKPQEIQDVEFTEVINDESEPR